MIPSEKERRMKCPVDDAVLVMSERSGVEIDYCPTCRGVWLDRGELDKILDRVAQDLPPARPEPPAQRREPAAPPAPPVPPPSPQERSRYGDPFDDGPVPPPPPQPGYTPQPGYPPRRGFFFGSGPSAPSPEDYYRGGYGHHPRRRRSWLDDLFD
ncbi:zf-TFIIB domain-containing protein [Ruania zhangjianzhongii]|uniref:TFIIB-type zinc ribbon-containing protein n=1 Tax=Ruania zhangjianzhongii TaxID=2603206 RepID=UPI0039A35357